MTSKYGWVSKMSRCLMFLILLKGDQYKYHLDYFRRVQLSVMQESMLILCSSSAFGALPIFKSSLVFIIKFCIQTRILRNN